MYLVSGSEYACLEEAAADAEAQIGLLGSTLLGIGSSRPQRAPPNHGPEAQPSAMPKAHMTKAELKRRQWDRERGNY